MKRIKQKLSSEEKEILEAFVSAKLRSVEEAVRARIFELTANQAKSANTKISKTDLSAIIDKALNWARKKHRP